jgi:hypothetical protein
MPAMTHDGVTCTTRRTAPAFPCSSCARRHAVRRQFWARMPYNRSRCSRSLPRDRDGPAQRRPPSRRWRPRAGRPTPPTPRPARPLGVGRTHIMAAHRLLLLSRLLEHARSASPPPSSRTRSAERTNRSSRTLRGAAGHAEQHGLAAALAAARRTPPSAATPSPAPGAPRLADPAFAAELEGLARQPTPRSCGSTVRACSAATSSSASRRTSSAASPPLLIRRQRTTSPRATAERLAALAPNAELVLTGASRDRAAHPGAREFCFGTHRSNA